MTVTNEVARETQTTRPQGDEPAPFRPRIWVITNGRQGSIAQADGLIAALGAQADTQYFEVNLGAPLSWLAPNGPAPLGHVGKKGKKFAPPWPDIVISIGRFAAVYAQKIKRVSKGAVFLIALQNPRMNLEKWDHVGRSQGLELRQVGGHPMALNLGQDIAGNHHVARMLQRRLGPILPGIS